MACGLRRRPATFSSKHTDYIVCPAFVVFHVVCSLWCLSFFLVFLYFCGLVRRRSLSKHPRQLFFRSSEEHAAVTRSRIPQLKAAFAELGGSSGPEVSALEQAKARHNADGCFSCKLQGCQMCSTQFLCCAILEQNNPYKKEENTLGGQTKKHRKNCGKKHMGGGTKRARPLLANSSLGQLRPHLPRCSTLDLPSAIALTGVLVLE